MTKNLQESVKLNPLVLWSWRLISRALGDRHVQGTSLLALGISAGAVLSTFVSAWMAVLAIPVMVTAFLVASKGIASMVFRLRLSTRRGRHLLWTTESGWVGDTNLVKNPARIARGLVDRGFELDAIELLEKSNVWKELGNSYLRKIFRAARNNGQIVSSLKALSIVAERTESAGDARLRTRLQAEVDVMNGKSIARIDGDVESFDDIEGSVVHVVGKTILDHQNGYTIRTHALGRAQVDMGFKVGVVGQMGFFDTHGLENWSEKKDGVEYLGFAGPRPSEMRLDHWLSQSVENLISVVRHMRPAVIHAHSDFLNAIIANEVAKHFHLPFVYEVRGFWEETLLTNLSQRNAWRSVEEHVIRYGPPEAYTLRRQIEHQMRDRADAIVTLDDDMAERIRKTGRRKKRILLSPNGAELPEQSDKSLHQDETKRLREELGFPAEAVVVGLASTLVPYEGVDILIDAVATLQKQKLDSPVALLIVGDGAARRDLEKRANDTGLRHAVFTGQVANQKLSPYVAMLDIAVFPRISTPVTEKVQPLKPIEALGMGCSVVVSSVAPLKALADESQSIKVFEAGKAGSLARELRELVVSPITRADLGKKGKKWVRDNRTWSKNAAEYANLYKNLNPKARSRGVLPLEEFIRVTNLASDTDVAPSHFDYARFPSIELHNLDWANAAMGDRTWGWVLHAWDFMDGTLRRLKDEKDKKLLRWCWGLAESWLDSFEDGNSKGTMAFYDMAVAQRSVRLGFLGQALLAFGDASPAESNRLMSSLAFHAEQLADPKNFSGWNNHGLYTALAGLSLARRFPSAPWASDLGEVSKRRAEGVVSRQFLPDGGHVEHSFDYHRMVLKSLIDADRDGLLDETSNRFSLEAAKQALTWMIRPDGYLEQVGDTPYKTMKTSSQRSGKAWWLPSTESWAGDVTENFSKSFILREAGFLFIRERTRRASAREDFESYLTFSGSFHSRTHKHADDLSITWFDLGREILIDAGRYGYGEHLDKDDPRRLSHGFFYASPERQYIESTKAHNTVEADGLLHDRVSRTPYGAVRFLHREANGVHWAAAMVDHGFWSHDRSITLEPSVSLEIKDKISSKDGDHHSFRQWFNLPGDFGLKQVGKSSVVFEDQDGLIVSLQSSRGAALVFPVRGSYDPEMRGFRSRHDRQLEPCWSLAFERRGAKAFFATKISLNFVGQ